ncbi:hypothetical protein OG552_09930 [Streptomyces sp. NBC_01476]|uniref:hypothetical protein n=1 Tax=Streptomyces sp. NBC_01476 TaxID=2903881 RepID=UPI002E3426BF|nr:hypothetical protein [Streptomyces sp. NBC_01476]
MEKADMLEAKDPAEAKEAQDPMDSAEPVEPIDRTDSDEQMDSSELRDRIDHREDIPSFFTTAARGARDDRIPGSPARPVPHPAATRTGPAATGPVYAGAHD